MKLACASGGGTGLIGRTLVNSLKSAGHRVRVITRSPKQSADLSWNTIKLSGIPEDTDVIINLCGRSIGEVNPLYCFESYRDAYMKDVLSSRIDTTKVLVNASKTIKLKTFINASAVGFYAPTLKKGLTESTQYQDSGLITRLVKEWEAAATLPPNSTARQFQLRLGVVLSKDSNFIQSLYPSHRLGLGGPMGSGKQWISWIHLDDVIGAIEFLINSPKTISDGPVNLTTPNPVRQVNLSKALAETLNAPKLPLGPYPTPSLVFKMLLGPDRATLVLDGTHVLPKKLLDAGFQFKYPRLEEALEAIFGRKPNHVSTD